MDQQPRTVEDYSPESGIASQPHPLDEPHLPPPPPPPHIPSDTSCSLVVPPPPVTEEGFALQAPPTATGYAPGCYLPVSSTRPGLNGGFYNGATASSATYTQTSWSTYQPGGHLPTGRDCNYSQMYTAPQPYSNYFSSATSYSCPPPPLHHPEPAPVDSTSPFVGGLAGRKRQRAAADGDAVADDAAEVPAKNACHVVPEHAHNTNQRPMLEIPTPPDSSSDRSDTVSPQSYLHHHHYLQHLQPPHASIPAMMPPATTAAVADPFPLPPPPLNGVHVTLSPKTEELWNLFYMANTEMIVTKNGRCLFPLTVFTVSGLVRKKDYNISIRGVNSDRYRYKYLHNTWTQVSESEFTHDPEKMIAVHPSSPQSGTKWMAKDVDFKSVKITHYPKSKGGDILLNTMHKYFFEVVIEEHNPRSDSEALVFPFHITRFIAVTAYQSAKLTELKKEKNPFARGVKHHESETDGHSLPPRSSSSSPYDGFSYPSAIGYSVYPTMVPAIPYPTPWTQNGRM